ncbi:MAG: serine/threonine-protein kinase, partial [Gemmatimonadales bacterium]
MSKCFGCATEIAPSARYCGQCGLPVVDPQGATVIAPPEPGEGLEQRLRHIVSGEYEIDREIGSGGMAVVYRATEVGLGRVVALKVLRPDLGLSKPAAERFKREAQMVAGLDHPNIIPVYRVGRAGSLLHIAMKFVEGKSLDAVIDAHGALPVPVIIGVLRDATQGLAFAHERGIVHRDVKGANILIDLTGRVVLSDFGVAVRASDVALTAPGTVIGTPAFMSPEQCSGLRATPQSDQYSLGVVGFQMIAGVVPFEADTLAGMMQHHFFTPPPPARTLRDDLPAELAAVVERALAKRPEDRYETTNEMLAAVEAIPYSQADQRECERLLREFAHEAAAPLPEPRRLRADSSPTLPLVLGAAAPPRR